MLTQKEQEQLNRLLKKRNQAIREQKKNRKIFEDECKKTFGMPVEEVSYKLSEYEKMVRENCEEDSQQYADYQTSNYTGVEGV